MIKMIAKQMQQILVAYLQPKLLHFRVHNI